MVSLFFLFSTLFSFQIPMTNANVFPLRIDILNDGCFKHISAKPNVFFFEKNSLYKRKENFFKVFIKENFAGKFFEEENTLKKCFAVKKNCLGRKKCVQTSSKNKRILLYRSCSEFQ